MKQSSSVEVLRDSKPPNKSPNTRLVSAALAAGFQYGHDKPFVDAIEVLKDGSIKRDVVWLMDGSQSVEFMWVERDQDGTPVAHTESIKFKEFRKRYLDLEWCRSNPDHPIAYMRGTHWHHSRMLKQIKGLPQMDIIRRGKRTASIPTTATPEERAAILKLLNK